MTERKIEALEFGGEIIYIEVSDVKEGTPSKSAKPGDGYEYTSAGNELEAAGARVDSTIRALARTVRKALEDAQPDEWTLEVNIGFKGKAGIPFITEGEANGAVKVSAKWKKSDQSNG